MNDIDTARSMALTCPFCGGGVLTAAADHLLASDEQRVKCRRCGRLHPGDPTLHRGAPTTTTERSMFEERWRYLVEAPEESGTDH